MPLNPKQTTPESEFEAQLRAAIKHAFPWLPDGSVVHQKTFSFKFGHADVTVDSRPRGSARARADILVSHGGQRLAIFELKKRGLPLTKDDEEQGLSYARMLHPRPPLVVISNSEKVKVLSTETGEEWQPEKGHSADSLKTLIERASVVAQSDLEAAVATLMGSNSNVWAQALRHASSSEIEEKTGSLGEPLKPFARDFLLPRRVTQQIRRLLGEPGHRLIMLEGSPLSGKSSILRELCAHEATSTSRVVLYVDADYDIDLFERIADVLGGCLDWRISGDQAKEWLRNLSKQDERMLVLALDNVRPDRYEVKRAIETLTTNSFGQNLKIVLAVDDAAANQLCRSGNSRESSVLGRRATRVPVSSLDRDEFHFAKRTLQSLRMTFARGAVHSVELRSVWLLRAIAAITASSKKYADPNLVASISPVPGLEVLKHASHRFDTSEHPFNLYRELAQALFEDATDLERPYQLKLELMDTFLIRRTTALRFLDRLDLESMREKGLIRESVSQSNENTFVIRLPELMAFELALIVASQLALEAQADPQEAAAWLVGFATNLQLGEVIAAFAILEMMSENDWQDFGLISAMRQMKPTREKMSIGSKLATRIEGIGVANITVQEDGLLVMQLPDGSVHIGQNTAVDDVGAYSILAFLAGFGFEDVQLADGSNTPARADPELLLDVAATPYLLRRAGGAPEINAILVHDIGEDLSAVCHHAGIVEPITWSIIKFLGREDVAMRDALVNDGIDRGKLPLLSRLDAAVRYLRDSADDEVAQWANDIWTEKLNPAMDNLFPGFAHD